jgi:hypothetical protein
MACSGSHCDNHGTGVATCSSHRGSCSSNRPLNAFGITTGDTLVATELEHMRVQIRAELARWNQHSLYNFSITGATALGSTTPIDDTHVEEQMQMVSDVHGSNKSVDQGVPGVQPVGDVAGSGSHHSDRQGALVEDTDWGIASESVRVKYNTIRQNCICNSDCSCNAVCSCHNDCGCNYSDPRLKMDVYKMM